MKSIMQEASSIAKAIEKGWEKAGKPAEFSVKIFEEPQKNFIGLTTKPAKIALLFDEAKSVKRHEPRSAEEQPRRVIERREPAAEKNRPPRRTQNIRQESVERGSVQKPNRAESTFTERPSLQKTSSRTEQRQYTKPEITPNPTDVEVTKKAPAFSWTPDMLNIVQDWLNQVLVILGKSSVTCHLDVDQNVLKVNFSDSILDSAAKDKLLFRSFAFLLMQLLRSKARKRLRGLKIVLATQQG